MYNQFFTHKNYFLKLLLCCTFFICSILNGQEVLKNFEAQYSKSTPNTPQRFEIAGKYAQALFFNDQQEKAFNILNQNIQLAEQKSDGKYAAYLYSISAMNNRLENNLNASNHSLEKAKKYSNQTTDQEIKGYVSYCEGWLNVRNNEESKAVKNFIEAAKHYEKAPKSATILGRLSATYKELTSIYANWDDYELQEKYSKLSLEVAIKQNNPNAIFDAYMMMGYLYEQQFTLNQKNIYLRDLSEKYYVLAINTYNKNKAEIPFPSNLSFVANNLANLYLRFYPKVYRDKALYYAELAKNVSLETDQANHLASSYGLMAEIALEKNDYKTAKSYLLNSLKIINESALNDQQTVLSIYESLSDINEKEGNFAEALRYHKMYVTTYKSIYDQEKIQLSKRLEAQFEKERQQQQMIRLQLESEKKEQQIQLMHSLGIQQEQELTNSKLSEEFQRKKLKLSQLESDKRAQELTISKQDLRLSKLENKNRKLDLVHYIQELNYKNKINKYYIVLIVFFVILLLFLFYFLKQRTKSMKQREELYNLELEKERQNSKISTLTALLDGQELERARLARDLHDGLGGLLSGTKIQLTHLNDKINEQVKPDLDKSIHQLDGAVDELRRVAHNLMPDLLIKYGLEEALKEYAIRMSNDQLDVDVQFLSYTDSLNKETQLFVYRIIQELVNNAIKHANASQIIIQFVEDSNYTITVEDDGKGFDINDLKLNQSAGLHNIQSRVEFLKGTLNIHSEENLGTSIEFQFPKI
ncbi:Signal transduction histidine kinase [Algoriella xinjiangensis]|uniref:histidine kinase n=1 Tax=Algoriella xinjiangensis TaxID=684065 RepID=A0A1I4SD90_9FLAO|nr:sensor histidine kinase [Algoriella xinjiangensis]SFM62458.1 Signal transduction histidine kinase [Algoriella xinjiangensis]VDH16014.1 Sensor protein degS [Algoriella xinjiangensis]